MCTNIIPAGTWAHLVNDHVICDKCYNPTMSTGTCYAVDLPCRISVAEAHKIALGDYVRPENVAYVTATEQKKLKQALTNR